MNWRPPAIYRLLKDVVLAWSAHRAPRLGASLAYYTLFAIAPLLLLTLAVGGLWFGADRARDELFGQLYGLVGKEGGSAIQSLVTAAANRPTAGVLATCLAILALGAGATGVFVELQDALNTIWEVKREPGRGLRNFIHDRLLSFAMVLGIGFLLLVSLVLSTVLAGLGKYASGWFAGQGVLWEVINLLVSFSIITLLFAMIFKVLPDVKIPWRDVWIGAVLTALLFNLGKFLIGFYLGRSSVASAYGAAGSFVILLLWVYYSAQILFFGAEFTRAYSHQYGSRLRPVPGARLTTARAAKHPGKKSHDRGSRIPAGSQR